jgi:hypothetical protein
MWAVSRDPEVALHRLTNEGLLVLVDERKLGELAEDRNILGAPLGAPQDEQTEQAEQANQAQEHRTEGLRAHR